MLDYYYEVRIVPSGEFEAFESFIGDRVYCGFEEDDGTIILRGDDDFAELLNELAEFSKELSELCGNTITFESSSEKKPNEDWIQSYKNSVEPIEVGNFRIRASWHEAKEGFADIVIDPSFAFGTGHHESTKNCILALQQVVKDGDSVLDIGCGSGILGIVSAKLGADVDMCDTDPLAVSAAEQNFIQNDVSFNEVWQGSASQASEQYDLVTANITADILIAFANEIKRAVKPDGTLILSGILDRYEEDVKKAYKELAPVKAIKENEWVTLIMKQGSR